MAVSNPLSPSCFSGHLAAIMLKQKARISPCFLLDAIRSCLKLNVNSVEMQSLIMYIVVTLKP
jgi:hypothetical protein